MAKDVSETTSLKKEIAVYEGKVAEEQERIDSATRWIAYHQKQRTNIRCNRRVDRKVSEKLIKRHTDRICYEKFRRDCAEVDMKEYKEKLSALKERLAALEPNPSEQETASP